MNSLSAGAYRANARSRKCVGKHNVPFPRGKRLADNEKASMRFDSSWRFQNM